jgi:small subunit ribosomal protein S11
MAKTIKKEKRTKVDQAKIYVTATFNNTLVTACDNSGNTIAWESSGSAGFKGTRKATPYAATTTVERLSKKIKDMGVMEVEVYIKGPGPGRDAALRAIKAAGLRMNLIADVTPIAHNGTRLSKKRRV